MAGGVGSGGVVGVGGVIGCSPEKKYIHTYINTYIHTHIRIVGGLLRDASVLERSDSRVNSKRLYQFGFTRGLRFGLYESFELGIDFFFVLHSPVEGC